MIQEKLPFSYSAYGLNVASEIEITGPHNIISDQYDVFIHEGTVPENLTLIENKGPVFQSNEHEFLLHLNNLGSFHAKNGNEIVIKRFPGIEDKELSTFITGPCFGSLLHQRGLLPLHASSVIYKSKGLLLTGVSGSGKSTLAAALVKEGCTLIADDISCVTYHHQQLTILPSFPVIKMWHDSLLHLGYNSTTLQSVRSALHKYFLPVQQYCNISAEIHYIFILNSFNKKEVVIQEIQGIEKFKLIKRNTYLFKSIAGTRLEQTNFQTTSMLSRNIPAYIINRPSSGIQTKELMNLVISKIKE